MAGWRAARCESGLAFDVPLGQLGRCTGQPTVHNGLPKRLLRYRRQLDQHRGVPVEVGNGEQALGSGGEYRLLLTEVLDADRDDRTLRNRVVAEPLDVRLAE